METIINIPSSADVKPRQARLWGEFLDMLCAKAEAEVKKEGEPGGYVPVSSPQRRDSK